jgi:TonB family protein
MGRRLVLAIALLAALSAFASSTSAVHAVPFSEQEIETGLRNGVTPARLTTLVEKNGVDFTLTPEIRQRLIAAGADQDLLDVIGHRIIANGKVSRGVLLYQVAPVYPAMARTARVQGAVVLEAVIDKQGNVAELKVISGHPMLTQAALDAVKQWKYEPYRLNGEPVTVDTTITVNFQLSGG